MNVDNFDIIRELLTFNAPDNYYFVQVLMRKKDAKKGTKVNGTNNNSRLIKDYYIKSLEDFDFYKPEIIELCKLFNARAGIDLNTKSLLNTSWRALELLTANIQSNHLNKVHKIFASAAGKVSGKDKKWIIDLDGDQVHMKDDILKYIHSVEPFDKEKLIAEIPSKNGLHLITIPFNLSSFKDVFKDVDIHKQNPTNLYIPV